MVYTNHGLQRTRDPTRSILTWIQIQSFSCETIKKGNFTNILYMNIASNTMFVFPRILLIFFYLFFISLNFYFFFFLYFGLSFEMMSTAQYSCINGRVITGYRLMQYLHAWCTFI